MVSIYSVEAEGVLSTVRQALRHGLNTGVLNDFLASIDWSGVDHGRPEIANLLGQMEGWAAQYEDDGLTRARYVGHLLGLLPENDRRRYLVQGGGPVAFTVSRLVN